MTFPLVQPATVIVVAYTTIQSFKAFDLIIASTGGGPNHATEILATLIYSTAFRNFEMGYAAAQSVIFMIVIAAITILQRRAEAFSPREGATDEHYLTHHRTPPAHLCPGAQTGPNCHAACCWSCTRC